MQLVWPLFLTMHLIAAVVWLVTMPSGFPSTTTAYWVNEVAPWLVLSWALLAIVASAVKRLASLAPALLVPLPAFWIAFGASMRFMYPSSSGGLWMGPMLGGMVLSALWVRRFGWKPERAWLVPLLLLPSVWVGWRGPLALRAPDAATHPLATALPTTPTGRADSKVVKLTRDAQLRPSEGRLVLRHGDHILTVQPLLAFDDRSPDRTLVSLAPPDENTATSRKLEAVAHEGGAWTMRFAGEPTVLEASVEGGGINLVASTQLAREVYSHASTFTELTLRGHKQLFVELSPIPKRRFEVRAFSDPSRFAYVDAAGMFHVVEGRGVGKGPYTDVATGKLGPNDALTITLYDGDTLLFALRFDDWAKQAATAPSPTAGWGVPQNVIQMMRSGAAADAPALITLSLASTAIGRSTQSVGYAPGVYRNRLRVESR